MRHRYVAALLAVLLSPHAHGDDFVWWEGEAAAETNFPARTWLRPQDDGEAALLSGGAWLTNTGEREGAPAVIRYHVDVPQSGTYAFWTRKFWRHGPFQWRFDGGAWSTCGRDIALADHTDIRTHVTVNWVHLGSVELEAGRRTLDIELLVDVGEDLVCGFDCFILSRGVFAPNGALRPGERTGLAAPGWFAWEPETDPFTRRSLFDLRYLNEAEAGEHGRVTRTDDGDFALGDGSEVRFWAVNVSTANSGQDRASIDYLARRLAKLGVNMVRFHAAIFDDDAPDAIDAKKLDDLHYLVHAMKEQGIYTALSFYFPLWIKIGPRHGLGYDEIDNDHPFGLVFFRQRFQAMYWAWLRGLLVPENPYTGLTLAADPAVAMIEAVNEDSLFWFTMNQRNVPESSWALLEKRFGRWLIDRHGSLDEAYDAWGGARERGDDEGEPRATVRDIWWLTPDADRQIGRALRRRLADQARFFAETQRAFYAAAVKDLRSLGYDGLVVAGNWKTAAPERLGPLEMWTYLAGDVIDRHAYFGGEHVGDGAGYSVREGHRYVDRAVVREPEALPVQAVQIPDRPQMISELGWPNPNRFRAEATFLSAAYGSLQSIDALVFFSLEENRVNETSMRKFAMGSPVTAATFPAAALAYRRGDVRTAPNSFLQTLDLEELFALRGVAGAAAPSFDSVRDRVDGDGDVPDPNFDRRAFIVGPVHRKYLPRVDRAALPDPAKHIDTRNSIARSATSELVWDWNRGFVIAATPRTVGAAGFLGAAGPLDLRSVLIDCDNEYASIMLTTLDDAAIKNSRRILIQAMTEERLYGYRAERGEIADLGRAPFNIKEIDATIELRMDGAGAMRVVALDENGYQTSTEIDVESPEPGVFRFRLSPRHVYHQARVMD